MSQPFISFVKSFYKSAINSRAWHRPLRGAFLNPLALLMAADFHGVKLASLTYTQTGQGEIEF